MAFNPFQKTILTFLMLLIIASGAYSLTISVPAEIPAFVIWTFSVNLDATDAFDETKFYLGEKQIVTVYNNGYVVIDPFNGADVVSALSKDTNPTSNEGLKLNVSYSGLDVGEYTLKAAAFKAGASTSETSATIKVFEAINKSKLDETQKKLEDAETKLSETQQQLTDALNKISETEAQVTETRQKITETESKVSEASQKVEGLSESSSSISANVEDLSQKLSEKEEEIRKLQEDVEDLNAVTRQKADAFDITKIFQTTPQKSVEETTQQTYVEEVTYDENGNPIPVTTEAGTTATAYVVGANTSTMFSIIIGVIFGLIILGFLYWKKTHEFSEPLFKPGISSEEGISPDESGFAIQTDRQSEKAVNELYGSSTREAGSMFSSGPLGRSALRTQGNFNRPTPQLSRFSSTSARPEQASKAPQISSSRITSTFMGGESQQKQPLGVEPEGWHGRFAYDANRKPSRPLKEESKGFSLGDLIKKRDSS